MQGNKIFKLDQTFLDTAKSLASNLLDVLVASRLEVLVQAQSIFIDMDFSRKLTFDRDWKKLKSDIEQIEGKLAYFHFKFPTFSDPRAFG